MPLARAASEMKKIYGNINRLSWMVRFHLSGATLKP